MNRVLFFVGLLMLTFVGSSCSKQKENLYLITAKNGLNVRAIPSSNGKVLGKVEYYDRIEVDTIVNGWAQIQYNDQKAYVSAKYIEKRADYASDGFDLFIFIFLLLLFGGGGTVAVRGFKKDGTLDRRFKANRNR